MLLVTAVCVFAVCPSSPAVLHASNLGILYCCLDCSCLTLVSWLFTCLYVNTSCGFSF